MSKYGKEKKPRKMAEEYQTPVPCALNLLAKLKLSGTIFEPFAGGGNICKAAAQMGNPTVAYDIRDYGWPLDRVADFYELEEDDFPEFDHIVTNPPYGKMNMMIKPVIEKLLWIRSLKAPKGVLAMLLPADYDNGSTRTGVIGENPYYRGQIKVCDRIIWIEGTNQGGTANFNWYIWGPYGYSWETSRPLPVVDYMRAK